MFGIGHFRDVSKICGLIKHAELFEAPIPKLITFDAEFCMISAVAIAARVAQPHIVASASGDESRGTIRHVDDPLVCGGEETMLAVDGALVLAI